METLYKIQDFLLELLHIVWGYAEPYILEIIVFLILATFFFGFIGSSR